MSDTFNLDTGGAILTPEQMAEALKRERANYMSAVAGRMAFRNAYRRCLPVVRAAEALAVKWNTPGQKVDSDDFYEAVNAVFEAVAKRNSEAAAQDDRAMAAVAETER